MNVTIDRWGRIVIPPNLRELLNIKPRDYILPEINLKKATLTFKVVRGKTK